MKRDLLLSLITELVKGDDEDCSTHTTEGSKIKIVVYQRGWVAIGKYSEEGEKCILRDAYIIRQWGTEDGLGQLALKGKQSGTKLEKTGTIRALKLTTVNIIDCIDSKWKEEL